MSPPPAVATLLTTSASVEADAILAQAAALGVGLRFAAQQPEGGRPLVFEGPADVRVLVMPIDARYPNLDRIAPLPWSPPAEQLAAHRAHLLVAVLGLPAEPRVQDPVLARLALAVGRATDALGLLFGSGISVHRLDFASALLESQDATQVPVELVVDLRLFREPSGRMAVLTHGLPRYGREDFLVTAPTSAEDAISLARVMARWMIEDPKKELPTDDTVGRTDDEQLKVQREESPLHNGATVIRLDLD